MSGSCSAPVCASAASQRIHIHGSWRSVPHRTHSRTQASPQRSLTSFSSAPARRIPTRRIRRLSCRTSWGRVRSARSTSTTPAPALSLRPILQTATLNPARQRPYWLSRRKRFRLHRPLDLHSVRRRCRCGRLSGDRGRIGRHSVHLHCGRRLGCRVPAHGSPAGRGSAFR